SLRDGPLPLRPEARRGILSAWRGLNQLYPGPGAVLVLLRGAAADTASADHDAVLQDRHRALAHDHLAAGGRGDAARGRLVGARLHVAAGAAERRRGDRLALAAIGACPDRVVHALERDEAAAGVDHRGADLDVDLLRLGDGALNDPVGFFQCDAHRCSPGWGKERVNAA